MNAELFLTNLLSWGAQVLIVVSMGAILSRVLRIQHPGSHLIYCHLLLVGSIMLPLTQPWQHPMATDDGGDAQIQMTAPIVTSALSPTTANLTWAALFIGVLIIGAALRLLWLVIGFFKMKRYERRSEVLSPLPESIDAALRMVNVNVEFRISKGSIGPVTFGHVRPVILLPESFLALSAQEQSAIACHELLHVRRKDWLATIIEELIAGILWFHPAVWWLVSQTGLAREQLVDAEVVRLTDAREPYLNALMNIARSRLNVDLMPASLFLRRRHLTQRINLLLTEVSMSKLRLLSSYLTIAVVVAAAGWAGFALFPMIGVAEARQASPPASGGFVVNRPPISYPADARQKRIEGAVVVEMQMNAAGEITNTRIISGPEELRQAALQTALQGAYGDAVARTFQVIVDFKLPATLPTTTPQAAQFAGRILDSSRIPLPGVRVTLTPTSPGASAVATDVVTDEKGSYEIAVAPGSYDITAQSPGFRTTRYDSVRIAPQQRNTLNFALPPETAALNPTPGDEAPPQRLRVGGNLASKNLMTQVKPVYPPEAKAARIQGVVILDAVIDKEGKVENLQVVSGHPLLTKAAIDAVKMWVYQPTLLNGQPVDITTTITINFAFSQ